MQLLLELLVHLFKLPLCVVPSALRVGLRLTVLISLIGVVKRVVLRLH